MLHYIIIIIIYDEFSDVVRLSVEMPQVEAVESRVNVSQGARAVLKCRIKSSSTNTDVDIRWFHNARPVDADDRFITQQSNHINYLFIFTLIHLRGVLVNVSYSADHLSSE